MKITLESTTKTVELNGVPARLWEGKTERGTPVFAFIALIGASTEDVPAVPASVAEAALSAEFEADLRECKAPTMVWPARLVL
jgi:hypothetical protein